MTFGMAQVKDEACQKTKKRRSKNLTETERIAMIDLFREYQLDIESIASQFDCSARTVYREQYP